jgi:hypothetical protein
MMKRTLILLMFLFAIKMGFSSIAGFPTNQPGIKNLATDTVYLGSCDTLHYPLPGEEVFYYFLPPNEGYVGGNNSFGDLAKADIFNTQSVQHIFEVFYHFVVAKNTSGTSPEITFAVWDSTGTDGKPGKIITSKKILLSSIVSDVNNGEMTKVVFDSLAVVNGTFYAGVILPVITGDTLALYSTVNNEVIPGTGWEMWKDHSWNPYTYSFNMNLTNSIFPLVCEGPGGIDNLQKSDVSIFPNPTSGMVYIDLYSINPAKVKLSVFNSFGQLLLTKEAGSYHERIVYLDLTSYSCGMNYILLQTGNQSILKKTVLTR